MALDQKTRVSFRPYKVSKVMGAPGRDNHSGRNPIADIRSTLRVPLPAGIRDIQQRGIIERKVRFPDDIKISPGVLLPEISVVPRGQRTSMHTDCADSSQLSELEQVVPKVLNCRIHISTSIRKVFVMISDFMSHCRYRPNDVVPEGMRTRPEIVGARYSSFLFEIRHSLSTERSAVYIVSENRQRLRIFVLTTFDQSGYGKDSIAGLKECITQVRIGAQGKIPPRKRTHQPEILSRFSAACSGIVPCSQRQL